MFIFNILKGRSIISIKIWQILNPAWVTLTKPVNRRVTTTTNLNILLSDSLYNALDFPSTLTKDVAYTIFFIHPFPSNIRYHHPKKKYPFTLFTTDEQSSLMHEKCPDFSPLFLYLSQDMRYFYNFSLPTFSFLFDAVVLGEDICKTV